MYEYTHSGYFYTDLQYTMYGVYHIIVSDISLKRDALGYINFMSQKV